MAAVTSNDASQDYCDICGNEIDYIDGRTICEPCDYDEDVRQMEDEWASTVEEPVWYSLSEVIQKVDVPQRPWQELMALAQILHDLRINDTDDLMRKLGAVYVTDDSKPLRGEYHWIGEPPDPNRFFGEIGTGHAPKEAKEPRLSNRRRAIMAQKEKKNENS